MDQDRQSRWRPTRWQVLWTVGIVVAAVVLAVVLIRIGYALQWTGFGQSKVAQDVRPAKTLWDWLDLLIVPAVLAIGGYLFARSENQRALQNADRQRNADRELTEQQAKTDREIADQRRQDEALQAYLDQMSAMLMPNKDQPSLYKAHPGDSLSSVARARTLTVLPRLDAERKARVVQFLGEAGLIVQGRPVLDLLNANLSGADLFGADLRGADLSGANLESANLSVAFLESANLFGAFLGSANLRGADLTEANLRRAALIRADLRGADLTGAILEGVNLTRANLNHAKGKRNEQLEQETSIDDGSLEGATMPNGQKYEDWLKSKGRGEAGENSGPS